MEKFLTPRVERAIRTATSAHREQKRKGSNLPYISHPFTVMCLAAGVCDDENILIACLFHDILEDVPEKYTRDQMEAEFGRDVVNLVLSVTKNSQLTNWEERSKAYLRQIREGDMATLVISACDKIHNLMSILDDYDTLGEDLWNKFNSTKQQQIWFYTSFLNILKDKLPNSSLTQTYTQLLEKLPA